MAKEDKREAIFAYAAALDQSSKQRNTILCSKNKIFIINFDKTILLHFILTSDCPEFKETIVFDAADYDSENFSIADGRVVFKLVQNGYVREKKCGVNKSLDFDTVSKLYKRYIVKDTSSHFILRKSVMDLLSDDLSHVEIHFDAGLKIIQRDIFSGDIIEITKDRSGLDLMNFEDDLADFDPVGIRTVDLDALFQKDEELEFFFVPDRSYFIVKGRTSKMSAILSQCLYDELGRLNMIGG